MPYVRLVKYPESFEEPFRFCTGTLHPYRFFFFLLRYYVIDFFSPSRQTIIMHFRVGLFFITCRSERVCVLVHREDVCSAARVSTSVCVCVCVTVFNNVLSIWALRMAISLTLPESHNAHPQGGRISHQWLASLRESSSRAETARNHSNKTPEREKNQRLFFCWFFLKKNASFVELKVSLLRQTDGNSNHQKVATNQGM